MLAADFAYANYGKRLSERRDEWLIKRGVVTKSGKANRPGPGTMIYIGEDNFEITGLSYPEHGILASDRGIKDLKESLLFSPPECQWMAVIFGKSTIHPEQDFVLNMSPISSVILEKSSGGLYAKSRPDILMEADALLQGVKQSDFRVLSRLCERQTLSLNTEKECVQIKKLLDQTGKPADVRRAMLKLSMNEISIGALISYQKWRESHV